MKKPFMILLGKRIRQARERAGLTQEKMAEVIGVSRTAVTRWESGDNEPKLDNLVMLSKLLQVSTDYLLGVEDAGERRTVLEHMASTLELLSSEICKELHKE